MTVRPEDIFNEKDTILTVAGKSFSCKCGCNVFRQVGSSPKEYKCNSCNIIYTAE